MKHVYPDKLLTCCNVCRRGGNGIIWFVDTFSTGPFSKEQQSFVTEFKAHGFDILTPGDRHFREMAEEYNRVSMRSARRSGMSCYNEYSFEKLCVCGDWMFTLYGYDFVTKSKSLSKRGGRRAGAGVKPKHDLVGGTAVIRVPGTHKEIIKEFVDFLVEADKAEGLGLQSAIRDGMRALVKQMIRLEERGALDLVAAVQQELDLLQQLQSKIPRDFLSK